MTAVVGLMFVMFVMRRRKRNSGARQILPEDSVCGASYPILNGHTTIQDFIEMTTSGSGSGECLPVGIAKCKVFHFELWVIQQRWMHSSLHSSYYLRPYLGVKRNTFGFFHFRTLFFITSSFNWGSIAFNAFENQTNFCIIYNVLTFIDRNALLELRLSEKMKKTY